MVFIGVVKNPEYLSTEYQHMVRIAGNDIPGDKKMIVGLTQIKGIGQPFANAVLDHLKINPNSNIGYLTESHVQTIENIIQDPSSFNFPDWIMNRRNDLETGKSLHFFTSDIPFTVRNDIEREKSVGSWRGIRHMYGLKVRGQRTRCTGRKGGAVGVKKGGKVLPPSAEGAVAATAEGEAPAAETGADKGAAATETKAPPSGEKKTAPKETKGASK